MLRFCSTVDLTMFGFGLPDACSLDDDGQGSLEYPMCDEVKTETKLQLMKIGIDGYMHVPSKKGQRT